MINLVLLLDGGNWSVVLQWIQWPFIGLLS